MFYIEINTGHKIININYSKLNLLAGPKCIVYRRHQSDRILYVMYSATHFQNTLEFTHA